MTTPRTARSEIFQLVNDAWEASVVTQNLVLLFQDVKGEVSPAPDANGVVPAWGRASVVHATGRQQTVGGPTRRFERTGTAFVQLFVPAGESLSVQMDDMVEVCLAAFEGNTTPSGVWFRDVGFSEVGASPPPNGPWYQVNVSAGFRYDEVR